MMSEEQKGTSEKSEKKDGIKPSQVTAAALAAVTAAFLGSTLGVAGTVAGAGIASVVSTVGGEFYLRSLRKTKEAAQRTKDAAMALADSSTRQQTELIQLPPQPPEQRTAGYPPTAPGQPRRRDDRLSGPRAGQQPQWGQRPPSHTMPPGPGAGRFVDHDRTVQLPQVNLQSPVRNSGAGAAAQRRKYSLRWPLIIGTSVAGFLIAILAITGFEGATGKSISGDQVAHVGHWWANDGSGQPDNPPANEEDGTVQPSQSQVPTTTPQSSSSATKLPTTSGSTPSTSAPTTSTGVPTPSTSTLSPSTPSTSAPEASKTPRTQNSPPSNSNNTPGTGTQRSGSGGGAGGN